MKRRIAIAGVGAVVLLGGLFGLRTLRGPVGDLGGAAGEPVPEFTSLDAARWQNSAPVSVASAKGEVVFVEGWSPG